MSGREQTPIPARPALLAAVSIAIGLLVALLLLEIALRILPTSDGLLAEPVDATRPVFRFAPNRTLTWSKDWDFAIVNRLRVNNAGFVNDQDYDAADPRPLLAVVGDSYVEAAMVPYTDTIQGRLARSLAPARRVYSFAASGAPLSQYLVWAREARQTWKAEKLAIVVIANDFDESLAAVKQGPGFHHYVREASGGLKLSRFDHAPSPWRTLAHWSALVRYLILNAQVRERIGALMAEADTAIVPRAYAGAGETYVGNTSAATTPKRIRESQEAIAAFLRDLATYSGWPPGDVVFLVDGLRYRQAAKAGARSYFALMRAHFLRAARTAGYEAIDLDEVFLPHHEKTGERFEFPTDAHWNGIAHGLAAQAVSGSTSLANWQ